MPGTHSHPGSSQLCLRGDRMWNSSRRLPWDLVISLQRGCCPERERSCPRDTQQEYTEPEECHIAGLAQILPHSAHSIPPFSRNHGSLHVWALSLLRASTRSCMCQARGCWAVWRKSTRRPFTGGSRSLSPLCRRPGSEAGEGWWLGCGHAAGQAEAGQAGFRVLAQLCAGRGHLLPLPAGTWLRVGVGHTGSQWLSPAAGTRGQQGPGPGCPPRKTCLRVTAAGFQTLPVSSRSEGPMRRCLEGLRA